jgi:hypothetical protein
VSTLLDTESVKCIMSESRVTLQLTVGQSVCLGVERRQGLMTTYLLLLDSYGLVLWGAPSLTGGRVCLVSGSVNSN